MNIRHVWPLLLCFSGMCVLSATDSDWLYDRWSTAPGIVISTSSQKFQVWVDTRKLHKNGELSLLLSNEGPGDALICQHVSWYMKDPKDPRVPGVSVPGPKAYLLLGPADGRRKLTSTAVFLAKPLLKVEREKLRRAGRLTVVFEILSRNDGVAHRLEVECD